MKGKFSNTNLSGRVEKAVLYNKYVLYFFVLLAICQFIVFSEIQDWKSAAVLVTAGIVTSFFTKNMVAILGISIIISVVFKYGINAFVSPEDETGFIELV